jgi:hypothetical protein
LKEELWVAEDQLNIKLTDIDLTTVIDKETGLENKPVIDNGIGCTKPPENLKLTIEELGANKLDMLDTEETVWTESQDWRTKEINIWFILVTTGWTMLTQITLPLTTITETVEDKEIHITERDVIYMSKY